MNTIKQKNHIFFTMFVRLCVIGLLSVTFALFAKQKTGLKIKIKLTAIYAAKQKKMFDPKLSELRQYLKQGFGSKYSYFKLIKKKTFLLDLNKSNSIDIAGYGKVTIKYKGIKNQYHLFKAEFKDLNINIKLANHGIFIQAGRKYQKGIIIFVVEAESM